MCSDLINWAWPTLQMEPLTLSPLNYLFVHTFNSGKYCLGVFDNGGAGEETQAQLLYCHTVFGPSIAPALVALVTTPCCLALLACPAPCLAMHMCRCI